MSSSGLRLFSVKKNIKVNPIEHLDKGLKNI